MECVISENILIVNAIAGFNHTSKTVYGQIILEFHEYLRIAIELTLKYNYCKINLVS